eukprot:TRINITY_DN3195_c0_g1_i6.p1 TRINITY_DN3195_c0_g1~~TRINITY_DN3195_c0_g1_i6.p1  ORF type:complete len:413 (+),score=79.88 TRINITY_DN3195_c0_g1_i6:3-1241(+)
MLLSLLAVAAAFPLRPAPQLDSDLTDAVKIEAVQAHMRQLEAIGQAFESRAVATGYNASAEYFLAQLRTRSNLRVWEEAFEVPVWTQRSAALSLTAPVSVDLILEQDFAGMSYGAGGAVAASVTVVSPGCSSADFANFPRGSVALIQSGGSCTNFQKVFYAETVGGASAVLLHAAPTSAGYPGGNIYNSTGYQGGSTHLVSIPVLAVTSTVAQAVRGGSVSLSVDATVTVYRTYNVLAETLAGDPSSVLVVGAHLDSVAAGPGLVDNGSGASAVLEVALQFADLRPEPLNKVMFAFWGAEEIGLQGSYNFLFRRTESELANIAAYLNHDTIASPNFIVNVFEGATAEQIPLREACTFLQRQYEDFYLSQNISYDLTSYGGGSDYRAFLFFFFFFLDCSRVTLGLRNPCQWVV